MRSHFVAGILLFCSVAVAATSDGGVPSGAQGGWQQGAVLPGPTSASLDSFATPGVVGEVLASQLMGTDELEPLRPGTLGDVVSALGAFSNNGVLVPGVAAEFTPWALGLGRALTHEAYVKNGALREFARSSLSLATASDPASDGGVRGVAAIRFRFVDESDWRLNRQVIQCAFDAYGAPPPPPATIDGGVPAIQPLPSVPEEVRAAVRKCVASWTRWNATQVAAGVAISVRAPAGDLARTRADEIQGIFTAAFGIGEHVQILTTARYAYRFGLDASGPDPAIAARHLAGLGGRLVVKMESFVVNVNAAAGLEASAGQIYFKGLLGLTLQYQITDTLWVDSSVNGSINASGAPSALTFGAGIKWSYDFKQLN